MTLQRSLAVIPREARLVSPRLAILLTDDELVAFSAADPIYRCRRDDREGMRLAGAMLSDLKLAKVAHLATALGVSRETIHRNRKLYVKGGVAALREGPRRPKTPHKLTPPVQIRAQRCLDEGWSVSRAAKEVGLTEGTLRLAIRQGRLRRVVEPRVGRPAREQAPVPVATCSVSQRGARGRRPASTAWR